MASGIASRVSKNFTGPCMRRSCQSEHRRHAVCAMWRKSWWPECVGLVAGLLHVQIARVIAFLRMLSCVAMIAAGSLCGVCAATASRRASGGCAPRVVPRGASFVVVRSSCMSIRVPLSAVVPLGHFAVPVAHRRCVGRAGQAQGDCVRSAILRWHAMKLILTVVARRV